MEKMTEIFKVFQNRRETKLAVQNQIGYVGTDWTHRAQNRAKWFALMNILLGFWVP
jgi:hypothetical protein